MTISSRSLLPWLFCLGLALLPTRAAHAQLVQKSISFEGGTRSWFEHVPASYNGSKAVPLVISMHGAFNSGDQFAPDSGWMPVSDANGFIVVFPNGEGNNNVLVWHSWTFDGSKPDDISFLSKLIAQVEATYHIDTTRVYMTGFSNGGGMTSFYAAAHPTVVAAIAPLSAGWVTNTGVSDSVLKPAAVVPAWMWRGAKDATTDTPSVFVQDQQQTAFWVKLDGDNTTPKTTVLGNDTTSVYTGGTAEVRYTSVAEFGHDVAPDCASRVWTEFFSRFSRVGNAIQVAAPPSVKVRAAVPKAGATSKTNGSFQLDLDAAPAADLNVNYQLAGTAVNGVDYRSLPGTVTMPAGTSSERVRVRPQTVDGATGHRTVTLTLLPGDGYTLGDSTTAKVKIVEDL